MLWLFFKLEQLSHSPKNMRKPLALQWEEGDILFSLFKQKIKKESKEEIRKLIANCFYKDVVKGFAKALISKK